MVKKMTKYNVKLDSFEGPLDLLLHLINKAEVDIYDIPLTEITDQYINYIHTLQRLELDVASEYLVMAATLLVIKSKMLLPKHESELFEDNEYIDEDDQREELISRLIEYRRFKEAAETFREREKNRGLIFSKTPSDLTTYIDEAIKEPQRINATLYEMLDAFGQLLNRKELKIPKHTKILRDDFSIEKRMDEIINQLNQKNGKTSFFQLFEYTERSKIIVTFLAVLELIKAKKIICQQEANFTDISVCRWEEETFIGY
jgi:segregation and condensation protein A